MIVVSSPGSTSFSKNVTALLSSCTARLFALTVALTVIYVVSSSTSPTSSCLKKMGEKGGGETETEELARPKRPAPPAYLPHLSRELKKGGHTTGREREGTGEGKGKNTQYVNLMDLLLNLFASAPQKEVGVSDR